jgi:glycerol-3-phosphate dehydrogenase
MEPMALPRFDVLVVGGGINGCGIARDAQGRDLSTLLVEQDDLASATSQWSSKLVHGGLRYLENYEFRLVAESLAERERLCKLAPHLVRPMQFVLPHEPHLRPRWMLRAGLYLYDFLGGKKELPKSFAARLDAPRQSMPRQSTAAAWGAGLKPGFTHGFVYSDAQADDARLTIVNALGAHELGAHIRTRTRLQHAARVGDAWQCRLLDMRTGQEETVQARALVNAAGPWVRRVLDVTQGHTTTETVRHVKGSHIVVPRIHAGDHAYILQNKDGRIVFVIPWQGEYSLIGTTDIVDAAFESPRISEPEIDYLLELANHYVAQPLSRADIRHTYAGVRPLFEDGKFSASKVTRDYVFKVDAPEGKLPLLSIFGGKLTTYRKLAHHALQDLRPYFPQMKGEWTHRVPLPGGEIVSVNVDLPEEAHGKGILRRHGSKTPILTASSAYGTGKAAWGRHFGAGLYQAEIDYLIAHEWAMTAEDVLMRRTKCGLFMDVAQQADMAAYMAERVPVTPAPIAV